MSCKKLILLSALTLAFGLHAGAQAQAPAQPVAPPRRPALPRTASGTEDSPQARFRKARAVFGN